MKHTMVSARAGFVLAFLSLFGANARADDERPDEVVALTAEQMLAIVEARREELRGDKLALQLAIDGVLRPRIDVEYAAQLSLGRFWEQSPSEQRYRFTNAFYESFAQKYGSVLLELRVADWRVLPLEADASATRALVRTRVELEDGRDIPVDYRMRLDNETWKIYDLIVEGISFVKILRETISEELERSDLETLINKLEAGAEASASSDSDAP